MAGTFLVVGDSFSDGASDWPAVMRNSAQSDAVSGNKILVDIEPGFAASLAGRPAGTTDVIIQGGVNDIRFDDGPLVDMQAAVTSMIAAAQTAGLTVYVMGVAPFKNDSEWTSGRQVITDAYNAWLLAQQATLGYTFIDIYAPFEGAADEMDAAYTSDDLHPSVPTGMNYLASLVDAVVPIWGTDGASNVNIKLWRGAVEPAETSASGNQYKAWRGAVEPASAAVNADDSIYIEIRRRQASSLSSRPTPFKPGKRGGLRDL